MKCWFAALGIAASLLSVAPAAAQQAPAGEAAAPAQMKPVDYPPDVMELATKLVKLSGTGRPFDVILPNVADETKNLFIKANPQMQLGIIEVVDRLALELVPRRAELDKALARIWASGFTKEEMQQLVDFYSTDVGKKFATMHPELLTVEMSTAQRWGLSVGRELTEKVAAELKIAAAADLQAEQSDIAGPALDPTTAQ